VADSSPLPPGPAGPVRTTAAWAPLPLGVLEVSGRDAVRFIDNFTTASVSALAGGGGSESFFTDVRGQVIALVTILATEGGLVILTPPGQAATLRDHLEHYHIREAVDLRDASAAHAVLLVAGPRAAEVVERLGGGAPPATSLGHRGITIGGCDARVVRVTGQGADGWWILVPASAARNVGGQLEAAGLPRADAEDLEALRLESRYPAAADIPPKTLPQELGRDALAISFTKGCYLGQETVARLDALGHVNRRLTLVSIDSPNPPTVPAAVTLSGVDVGLITSACRSAATGRSLGLGLLHVRALAGGDLHVAGAVARPVPEVGA